MQCPKQSDVSLVEGQLSEGPKGYSCPDCGGFWLPPEHYNDWQAEVNSADSKPTIQTLPSTVEAAFSPSKLDNRAALCPDCRHYLVRSRVTLKNTAFYVERCPNCWGIWCDRGEWQILQLLGFHTHLEALFSSDWQARLRELEQRERERQATIEKLGEDLAKQVFSLADQLENHPNGDFGVAYLMRRFDGE